MIIRKMAKSDIREVSRIHQKALPGIPSEIGQEYIKKFYQSLLTFPDLHICLVSTAKGKIIGSITATRDFKRTQTLLRKLIFSPTTALNLLYAILGRRISIKDIFYRIFFEHKVERFLNPIAVTHILTVFVEKEYRRKGVGNQLVRYILKTFRKEKVKQVFVDTKIDNTPAQKFYKSLGFTKILSSFDAILYAFDNK